MARRANWPRPTLTKRATRCPLIVLLRPSPRPGNSSLPRKHTRMFLNRSSQNGAGGRGSPVA